MILACLRLVRHPIIQQLEQLAAEKNLLQDRLESAISERTRIWSELERALEGERKAYQMQINERWQREYGIAPYPDAAKIPTSLAELQPASSSVLPPMWQGSGLVEQQTRDFKQQVIDRVQKAKAKSSA